MDLNMQTIGERIKRRRLELNLTQTQIKDAVGISSGNLSEIENGNRTPSMPTLYRLSEILNCSIDWIIKGDSSVEEKSDFFFQEDEKRLINLYRQMSTIDQEDLILIAEMKANKNAQKYVQKLSLSKPKSKLIETA